MRTHSRVITIKIADDLPAEPQQKTERYFKGGENERIGRARLIASSGGQVPGP